MQAFAFPFRFIRGSAERLEVDTDKYAAQKLLTAFQTRPNELPIRPDFGSAEPLFAQMDRAGFFSTVSTFFPEIAIDSFEELIGDNGQVSVNIEFRRLDRTRGQIV